MCENEKKKYHSIEMTTGSLWKNILLFSLPLMGSQVLEVLFNLSDVAVVGRFADYMALGAVGSQLCWLLCLPESLSEWVPVSMSA